MSNICNMCKFLQIFAIFAIFAILAVMCVSFRRICVRQTSTRHKLWQAGKALAFVWKEICTDLPSFICFFFIHWSASVNWQIRIIGWQLPWKRVKVGHNIKTCSSCDKLTQTFKSKRESSSIAKATIWSRRCRSCDKLTPSLTAAALERNLRRASAPLELLCSSGWDAETCRPHTRANYAWPAWQ